MTLFWDINRDIYVLFFGEIAIQTHNLDVNSILEKKSQNREM